MKLAIIGATGLVGETLLEVLSEENYFPLSKIKEIFFVASEKSKGKKLLFNGKYHEVMTISDCLQKSPDIAIFSCGSEASISYAKEFTKMGCFVVDNSSAWRLHDDVPLVVPEINGDCVNENTKLIANPNCSTIQMVLALSELHKHYKLKRIVVSTYQSVSGSGHKGLTQLSSERQGIKPPAMAYPHTIDLNVIPQGGDFNKNGYTSEEEKLVNETRKIFNDNNIQVSATVVRVPVMVAHSEAINAEFERPFSLNEVKDIISSSSGVIHSDCNDINLYPTPLLAQGKDEVFVGRVRIDHTQPNTLNMWVVSDNLRKGAATNAIQIAAIIINKKMQKHEAIP